MMDERFHIYDPEEQRKYLTAHERDAFLATLEDTGWSVLTIWECEVKAADGLEDKVRQFLDA